MRAQKKPTQATVQRTHEVHERGVTIFRGDPLDAPKCKLREQRGLTLLNEYTPQR